MAFTSRTRLVNPRLGTYFGIFAAAFAAVVLMAMMFEQLGATDALVRLIVFAGPIALYASIGLLSATRETQDYFACGRRVPAFFNGLALGIAALGGAGFLALTGAFFLIGFDALCLSIGWYAGLVFATLLFVPFLRKVGAYTVPTFLGRRFDSRTVRVVAAAVLSVPILLLLAAEARFAAYAAAWLLGPVRAADGRAGGVLRGGDRDRRRHALADLVERGPGHRRAAGAGGVGHHRRRDGLQPAVAADDARQRAACPDARGGGAQPAHHRRPELVRRAAGRGHRDAEQAHAAGVRQRRRHRLHRHVVRGGDGHCRLARRCCRAPAPRPASTRRASRADGRCWWSAWCC